MQRVRWPYRVLWIIEGHPTENNDGVPFSLMPLGPSSLMCLRLPIGFIEREKSGPKLNNEIKEY